MEKKKLPKEPWKNNDIYEKRMTIGNIVTRSQTPFVRVKNTKSDMEFFAEGAKHHPSSKHHVLVSMVGQYGAIPRMVMTRSTANELELDKNLLKVLKEYKKLAKKDPQVKELLEAQKEIPTLLNPNAGVEEVQEKQQSSADGKTSGSETSGGESSAMEEQSSSGGETTDFESSTESSSESSA